MKEFARLDETGMRRDRKMADQFGASSGPMCRPCPIQTRPMKVTSRLGRVLKIRMTILNAPLIGVSSGSVVGCRDVVRNGGILAEDGLPSEP